MPAFFIKTPADDAFHRRKKMIIFVIVCLSLSYCQIKPLPFLYLCPEIMLFLTDIELDGIVIHFQRIVFCFRISYFFPFQHRLQGL